jgi:hypothetical protein
MLRTNAVALVFMAIILHYAALLGYTPVGLGVSISAQAGCKPPAAVDKVRAVLRDKALNNTYHIMIGHDFQYQR